MVSFRWGYYEKVQYICNTTLAPGSRAKRWTELADALEALLGRHVDLVNPRYIRNPYFLQAVNASRAVIYDRQSAQAAR